MNNTSLNQNGIRPGGILDYYPNFARLADPECIRSHVAESLGDRNAEIGKVNIHRCRFSPSRGIIVSFEVSVCSSNERKKTNRQYYIYGVPAAGFAKLQRLAGRLEPLRSSLSRTPYFLERHNAVLCEFPVDLRIPEIQIIEDAERLNELICGQWEKIQAIQSSNEKITGTVKTLRYKPQSRLVGEYTLQCDDRESRFIIRFHRPEFGLRMYRLLCEIHSRFADKLSPSIPKPLFWLPEISAFAIERVNGETLADLLKTDCAPEAISRAGGMLARFHIINTSTGHELSSELFDESLEKALDILTCCEGSIRGRVNAILRELSSIKKGFNQEIPGIVHGDFHQGQMLYDDEKIWLLDFDRCHFGDRSTDVGNFLAQLTLLGIRGRLADEKACRTLFLDGYKAGGGCDWPREQIRYRYALGLLELAAKEIRRLKPDSQSSVESILDSVESSIGEL